MDGVDLVKPGKCLLDLGMPYRTRKTTDTKDIIFTRTTNCNIYIFAIILYWRFNKSQSSVLLDPFNQNAPF